MTEQVIINIQQLSNALNGMVTSASNAVQDSSGVTITAAMTVPTISLSNTSFMLPIMVNRSINAVAVITNSKTLINHQDNVSSKSTGSPPSNPPSDNYYCLECKCVYNGSCPVHHERLTVIEDTPFLSRAVMTIPEKLCIKSSLITPNALGVWSKQPINKLTRFGPLCGKICVKENLSKQNQLLKIWKIFQEDKINCGISVENENECNWMKFVSHASNHSQQNIIAYQHEMQIFFITNKDIEADKELALWYAPEYCKLIGVALKPEESCCCPHCLNLFTDISSLNSHIKFNHPDMTLKKWKCATCSRAFPSSTKYNIHLLSHMGIKPHKCNHCSKEFTDQSNLRMHLSIHTGEKKYQCDTCKRMFRQKAHLKSHYLTHTGEKKLKCHYCDKFFARASDVKQHEYQHTHERKYKCDTCNKNFFKLQNFKKHIKIHSGLREFTCQKCPKSFYTKYHLQRHLKTCKEIKIIDGTLRIVNEHTCKENKKNIDKTYEKDHELSET